MGVAALGGSRRKWHQLLFNVQNMLEADSIFP
jgi:hypothetical protein